MKHLRLFESFEDIDSICKKYRIENYTINPDGSVDVDGNVNLSFSHLFDFPVVGGLQLTKLPLKFGRVSGSFLCDGNKLTTLEGSPSYIGRDFSCKNNKLTTLEGGPREVGFSFFCQHNQLTTLKGSPEIVGGDFYCGYNQLTTLEGAPREVRFEFSFRDNPVYQIYELFKKRKVFMDSLDWDYIRGNKIVKSRFEEACAEAGIEVPESIKGYEYI